MNWPKIKKIVLTWLFLLSYKTMSHFSIRLWHVTKSGFYTTTSNDQLSGWTEKKLQSTFQSHTCTKKKKSRSLCGGLLPIWSTTAFWIPAKLLHLRSMLNKSMRCTISCNTCSQYWSTEKAQFFSTTMPNRTLHNQCFRSWMNWAMRFCLICHIHLTSQQPTTPFSSILTISCRENSSTTSRRQKMLSKSSLKHGFLHDRNKQTFLTRKTVLILINKDVLSLVIMISNSQFKTSVTFTPT